MSGVIADVTVRQIYENQGSRPLHARYVFPASTRAAVYGMSMTVGNQRVVAKIEERERAKRDFDRAKEEGKSASLLEQDRPNVFSMNVANIMPRDTITVELKYTELLVPTEGTYELVYPTVVGPRYSVERRRAALAARPLRRNAVSSRRRIAEEPNFTFPPSCRRACRSTTSAVRPIKS